MSIPLRMLLEQAIRDRYSLVTGKHKPTLEDALDDKTYREELMPYLESLAELDDQPSLVEALGEGIAKLRERAEKPWLGGQKYRQQGYLFAISDVEALLRAGKGEEPNAKTMQVIEDALAGRNMTHADSADDLLAKLNAPKPEVGSCEPGELLPCPFCGGNAERIDIDATDESEPNAGGSFIYCPECLASSKLVFGEKVGLEEAWNMRKPAGGEGK